MSEVLMNDSINELKAENNRLSIDLEKCHKFNELLLKYTNLCRLYFTDYLKVCKCEQNTDHSTIRSKFAALEQQLTALNEERNASKVQNNVIEVKTSALDELNAELKEEEEIKNSDQINSYEDMDTESDCIDADDNSCDVNTEEVTKNGSNLKLDSNHSFRYHSEVLEKSDEYKCGECDASFDALNKLKGHETAHKRTAAHLNRTPNSFVCQEIGCNKVFDKQSSLSVHISRKHKSNDIRKNYICDWIGCGHKVANNQDLTLHIRRRHTFEKPFKCDKCDKSYELEKVLRRHQKIHSNFRYECDFDECLYKTPNIWELKTHKKLKHLNEKRFECDFEGCVRNYKYEGDLTNHKKRDHINGLAYACEWPGCEARFTRSDVLNDHMLVHKNERKFKCEVSECNRTFNRKRDLTYHQNYHDLKFICEWPGCDMAFPGNVERSKHSKTHLNLRPFKCHECDKGFKTKGGMNNHHDRTHIKNQLLNTNKKYKQYKCDQCLRTFIGTKFLENHMNAIHSENPIMYCCDYPECDQQFKTSHALLKHKKIHTNGGQFKCKFVGCDKRFQTSASLLSHENAAHSKRFPCIWPECTKGFHHPSRLKWHLNSHQNKREFKCSHEGCDKAFVYSTHLKAHMEWHLKPKPFECDIEGCGQRFTVQCMLTIHKKKIHFL